MTITKVMARRVVFPRDNWTCQRCGRHMPPSVPGHLSGRIAPMITIPSRRFPFWDHVWLELDHIVPRSAGGPFTMDNLRALCSVCNKSKGANTGHADWPTRIQKAIEILSAGPPTQGTAAAVVRALTGLQGKVWDKETFDDATLPGGRT